jgi:hypothetical protein
MKNRYVHQISYSEWAEGKSFMFSEVAHLEVYHPINILLRNAIADFKAGKFSYDGATFVKERSKSLFEVAAFIHDWRNSTGYVSYKVDKEMLDIMRILKYNIRLIRWRYFYTRLTFMNMLRHKLKGTFISSKPKNLYNT